MSYYAPIFVGSIAIILYFGLIGLQSGKRTSYIAAVVEYQPFGDASNGLLPQNILDINSDKYVEFIHEAKINNADLIVFPEYGLTSLRIPKDAIAVRAFLVRIPEIGQNPCNLPDSDPVIRKLSCSARAKEIYVVINTGEIVPNCNPNPHEDPCHYNTNVVFNRKGEIIAKYHKFHLYFESQFHRPTIPDYVTFETDFGVTFGTFICFDIMFQHPGEDYVRNGIQNFVFTTAWVDELPFLTATQSNALWAMSSGSNLLVSGYHEPRKGRLGSGIFSGSAGPLNYTFDPSSGSKLIIAEVPIVPHTEPPNQSKGSSASIRHPRLNHFFLKEDLTDYSTIPLDKQQGASEATVCHHGFCCLLNYGFEVSTSGVGGYRLVAFSGFRKTAQRTAEFGWEVCGLTRCLNATLESCTEIGSVDNGELAPDFIWFKLSTTMDGNNLMKPSLNTLDTDLQSIPFGHFKFSSKEGQVEVESSTLSGVNVQTIAIIRRIY